WIEAGNMTCPITNQVLRSLEPIPNHTIRKMIQDWCVENSSYGIQRIPTPRIPVSSIEVSDFLSRINTACKKNDRHGCRDLVAKIKTLCKESERNRKCIISNGTGRVLAEVFEVFSLRTDENAVVLKEILSTLTTMFPLDGEARARLGSPSSLHSMVWFLKSGDLSERRNAVLLIKEVVSSDGRKAEALSKIEGAMEGLVQLIKEPICPTATKASLIIIYSMIKSSSSEKIISRFADMGLVSLLVETLVEAERSICEKAMAVIDGLCSSERGREEAYNNALTMPVLVKKILRVSDLATEVSVSILWKLCKNEKRENGGVLVEAVQVGAFQKLLLLLQVGCGERTKEKVTELLKLLNLHRDRLECIDSMDFKNLKRPF
ncbi:U-box domain-containing protein 21-like, partial [Carica papaya]|uniref:U-box domain-containing protein 21-like n=1 Tax=Carica papaya TaxID=3649 RepID=UPI000B8CF9D7